MHIESEAVKPLKLKKHPAPVQSAPTGNKNKKTNSKNDKKPTRLGEMLTDGLLTLVIWNVLFILTSIPIITLGPSMAALGFCTNALVTDDRPQKGAAKLYINAFFASFKKAFFPGLYFIFITLLFGAGFFVYTYQSTEHATYVSMSSISLVVLTIFWGVFMHLYPLMFEFDKTDWENKKPVITKLKMSEVINIACRTAMDRMIPTALALVFSVLFLGSLVMFLPHTVPLLLTIGFIAVAVSAALAHTSPEY